MEKEKQGAMAANQPSIIKCNDVPFGLSPTGLDEEAVRKSYLLLFKQAQSVISAYEIDRHNQEEEAILNCNYVDFTAKQWVDVMKEAVYTIQHGQMRPSHEVRDLVKGILQLYQSLNWIEASYYHGLGDLRNYGLQFLASNYGSDWDTMVRVHHIGDLRPNRNISHKKCKANILKAIDSIFLSPASGTVVYPPFFTHWYGMLLEWAKSDGYENPDKLINHPVLWPSSSRFAYFETLYTAYKGKETRDIDVKNVIDDVVLEVTGGTQEWVKQIPKNTPFERVYIEHKKEHPKPNLFLYARAATTGHMLEKIPGADRQQPTKTILYYKYIMEGGPEENNCKKNMYLETEITKMFPTLVDKIAVKLAMRNLSV